VFGFWGELNKALINSAFAVEVLETVTREMLLGASNFFEIFGLNPKSKHY